jgi:crossover junction endodeoxyribonuclease RuvC
VRIFGIDPGSERTGYGCVETDGRRHRLIACGAITAAAGDAFPQRLARIHRELSRHLHSCRPDCVAIENLFHAVNARSALKLGHARGVAMLAAVEAGCEIVEYTPAEVKRAVVGYGRAEKAQVQRMVTLLLGLDVAPTPHDAADALAVAICHLHNAPKADLKAGLKTRVYTRQGIAIAGQGITTGDAGGPAGAGVKADLQVRLRKPRSWRQYRPPTTG